MPGRLCEQTGRSAFQQILRSALCTRRDSVPGCTVYCAVNISCGLGVLRLQSALPLGEAFADGSSVWDGRRSSILRIALRDPPLSSFLTSCCNASWLGVRQRSDLA